MKRYDVGICPNECPGPAMDLWEDGEWVRYKDVEAALAEEKRRGEHLLSALRHAVYRNHGESGGCDACALVASLCSTPDRPKED